MAITRSNRLTPEEMQQAFGQPISKGGGNKMPEVMTESPKTDTEELTPNMVVHSPKHLWGLGSIQLSFHVRSLQEASAIVGEAQELFRSLEKGYTERLEEVELIENRVTLAQIETINFLAEEMEVERDYDFDSMTTTAASNIIRQLLEKKNNGSRQSQSRRRPARRGVAGRGEARRGRARRGTAGQGGRTYDNDRPGGATPGQRRYLADLYDRANEAEPNLEEFSFNDASAEIQRLESDLNIDR